MTALLDLLSEYRNAESDLDDKYYNKVSELETGVNSHLERMGYKR